jgi:hypothetical protein
MTWREFVDWATVLLQLSLWLLVLPTCLVASAIILHKLTKLWLEEVQ